ncbi:MAG TPA: hypothetical protein VJS17_08280 [Pyrinomonadaceae bacterium]|nr:hypothetical protein [Pyrinomonadaceae bacterium]
MKKTMIMRDTKTWLCSVAFTAVVVLLSGSASTMTAQIAQQTEPAPKPVKRTVSGGRDPFKKYEPPRVVVKAAREESPIPTIQARIDTYRAQKAAAMNARMPAPKPTTALLLSEIQVIGISRSPRGYAAIVEATPIKLTYVIYPGEPFFDGQLVAIEDSRLVFRRETVFKDGRRERAVEFKSLRQPSPVNSITAPANPSVAATKP